MAALIPIRRRHLHLHMLRPSIVARRDRLRDRTLSSFR
jgi:hypothetical protein